MNPIPRLFLLFLFCASTLQGAGTGIDLKGKLPEEYDWDAYFASGDHSTATMMFQAQAAAAVMKKRLDQLCTAYRTLLTKRGESAALKLFDEMQDHWEKMAAAEITFVGSAWDGGSGAKAAYPQHRFKVCLRRVKELRELKNDSMFLNE